MKKYHMSALMSLFLSFLILFCAMPAGALSAENYGDVQTMEIPPFQSAVVRPADYTPEDSAEIAAGVAVLRAGMTQRAQSVEVTLHMQGSVSSSVASEIDYAALEHTGNPKEGDYITYNGCAASIRYQSTTSSQGTVIKLTYTLSYFTDAAQEAELDTALAGVLAELDLWNASDYEKICGIYDYICDHVVYDYPNLEDEEYKLKYTAYAALLHGTSVCQGYALLFYRMALELGVDVRIIDGIGNGGAHAWNIVALDGLYYNVDATWDAVRDPYEYFLRGSESFGKHTSDDKFLTEAFRTAYPISPTDYNPHPVHNYVAVVTAPTCTQQGYTTYTCACGDSYVGDYVAALGHAFGSWYEVQAPTCTQKGSQRQDCSRCDASQTREIAAKGHSHTASVTAPTCTERGYTTYTCHCGDSYVGDYVAALGHHWDEGTVVKEPTEETEGETKFTCDRCRETKIERTPPLGHTHSYTEETVAPTCTQQGYTQHSCRCGDSYRDAYTDALGHDYRQEVLNPTCTEGGHTTYTCARCGQSYTDDVTAPAGHAWDEGVVTLEPQEETAGEKLYTCTVCGETKTEVIPELNHVHSYTAAVTEPTCTEGGYTTYTCACGDSYQGDFVEAAGHNYEGTVTQPTCTEGGYTTYTCHCGESFVSDHTEVIAHTYGEDHNCTVCGQPDPDYTGGDVPDPEDPKPDPPATEPSGTSATPPTTSGQPGGGEEEVSMPLIAAVVVSCMVPIVLAVLMVARKKKKTPAEHEEQAQE